MLPDTSRNITLDIWNKMSKLRRARITGRLDSGELYMGGQTMMAMGALTLLGIIILTSNSTMLQNERVVMDSEFGVAAISLATSIIEEIQGKVFDAATSDSGQTLTSKLTPANSLGAAGTETYRPTDSTKTDYNDVDDFHNFWIEYVADTTKPKIATFRGDARGFRADYFIRAKVEYVNKSNLEVKSLTQTWHKKVTLTVSSPSSRDTLVFPTIISYWN